MNSLYVCRCSYCCGLNATVWMLLQPTYGSTAYTTKQNISHDVLLQFQADKDLRPSVLLSQRSVRHSAVKVVITNNVSMCADKPQGDAADGNEKAEWSEVITNLLRERCRLMVLISVCHGVEKQIMTLSIWGEIVGCVVGCEWCIVWDESLFTTSSPSLSGASVICGQNTEGHSTLVSPHFTSRHINV